jgi:hypothetical protein
VAEFLTSPEMPNYIRMPGIVALVRAWLMFTVVLLQVTKIWPSSIEPTSLTAKALGKLGHWVGDMEMGQVCWQVFISVCCGLVCSGLANGLERE